MKLPPNATKVLSDAMKLLSDATKLRSDATKLLSGATKQRSRRISLPFAYSTMLSRGPGLSSRQETLRSRRMKLSVGCVNVRSDMTPALCCASRASIRQTMMAPHQSTASIGDAK